MLRIALLVLAFFGAGCTGALPLQAKEVVHQNVPCTDRYQAF